MEPTTSPENLPPKVIALIIGLSLLGGLAHFVNKLRHGRVRVHWLIELIGDCLYSLAAGAAAWMIATSLHADEYIAAAVAIVAGHLGARLIWLIQSAMLDKIEAALIERGNDPDNSGI